jgi:hypothetical protein
MAAVFEAKYIGTRGGWRDMSRTELEIEPESLKGLTGLLQVSAPAATTARYLPGTVAVEPPNCCVCHLY